MNKFPKISSLARVLLNIPVSSAFVERFFSIAGIITKKRSDNMSPKLICARSLLKANVSLLKEMAISCQ